MTIWSAIHSWFSLISTENLTARSNHHCDINPANGLPMVGGCGGVDIEGNPYGTDSSQHDTIGGGIGDASSSSGFSSWDSGIGTGNLWGD
jgi:hypothetical protein